MIKSPGISQRISGGDWNPSGRVKWSNRSYGGVSIAFAVIQRVRVVYMMLCLRTADFRTHMIEAHNLRHSLSRNSHRQ
jgi:hypothetical protein